MLYSAPAVVLGINRQSKQAGGLGLWFPRVLSPQRGLKTIDEVQGIELVDVPGTGSVAWQANEQIGGLVPIYGNSGASTAHGNFTYPVASTQKFSMTLWCHTLTTPVPYAGLCFSRTDASVGLCMAGSFATARVTGNWNNAVGEYDAATGFELPATKAAFCGLTVNGTALKVYYGSQSFAFYGPTMRRFDNTITANNRAPSVWDVAYDSAVGSRGWNGSITDIRIYPERVLSDQDMWDMVNPLTRWDLWLKPKKRVYLGLAGAGIGGANKKWLVDGGLVNSGLTS